MKIRLTLSALAALGLVLSCDKAPEAGGEWLDVPISVSIHEAAATRAVSDGLSADKLYFGVYNSTGTTEFPAFRKEVMLAGGKADFSVSLLKGAAYTLVFWAQPAEDSPYTVSETDYLGKISVDYTRLSLNDEKGDAFCKKMSITASGETVNAVLSRAVSRLNYLLMKEDVQKASLSGISAGDLKVGFTVKGVGTQLNAVTGEVTAYDTATEFTFAEKTSLSASYTVSAADDATLVCYVYLLEGKSNADITVSRGTLPSETVTAVPFKTNYKTNLIGSITGSVGVNISINPMFGDDNNVELN